METKLERAKLMVSAIGCVVLVTSTNDKGFATGTCVDEGFSFFEIGEVRDDWRVDELDDYEGELILSNRKGKGV